MSIVSKRSDRCLAQQRNHATQRNLVVLDSTKNVARLLLQITSVRHGTSSYLNGAVTRPSAQQPAIARPGFVDLLSLSRNSAAGRRPLPQPGPQSEFTSRGMLWATSVASERRPSKLTNSASHFRVFSPHSASRASIYRSIAPEPHHIYSLFPVHHHHSSSALPFACPPSPSPSDDDRSQPQHQTSRRKKQAISCSTNSSIMGNRRGISRMTLVGEALSRTIVSAMVIVSIVVAATSIYPKGFTVMFATVRQTARRFLLVSFYLYTD